MKVLVLAAYKVMNKVTQLKPTVRAKNTGSSLYLDEGPCNGCLQSNKQSHSNVAIFVSAKYRLFDKKNSIFSSLHLFTVTQYTLLFIAAAHLQV